MPAYYPVYLDLREQSCIVIGGNSIGEDKTRRLIEHGAAVTVISPSLTAGLTTLSVEGKINWINRRYRKGDLRNAFIAIVADTKNQKINISASQEARDLKVPLNIVDVTDLCTWIAPAIVRKGDVTVAISTGGASPALARRFREQLSGTNQVPTEHDLMDLADLAPILSDARLELAKNNVRVKVDHWQACITDDLIDLVKDGRSVEAKNLLMNYLREGFNCDCPDRGCKMLRSS